jgi:hypothetical protein
MRRLAVSFLLLPFLVANVFAFEPMFEAGIVWETGSGLEFVFPTDLDGGGNCDLVVTNGTRDSVSILLNTGSKEAAGGAMIPVAREEHTLDGTYLGGSGDDGFLGITVTTDGDYIYAAGYTSSVDFPAPAGACQTGLNSGLDIFVVKFDLNLRTLVAATILCGGNDEMYPAIAIDGQGHIIVAGYTQSEDFPTTEGVIGESFQGGGSDLFLSILDNTLENLIASTYLGGSASEGPYNSPGIAIAPSGDLYIAGTTNSTDFPTSGSAYNRIHMGDQDCFVSRLSPDLTSLSGSTYIGGSGVEGFPSLVLDAVGHVFLGLSTSSANYPTTAGVYNRTFSASYYMPAISRLSGDLSTLQASTLVFDGASVSLACDDGGNLYSCGHTQNPDYPTSADAYDRSYVYNDGFVSKFDNDLENLLASTFLSGTTLFEAFPNAVVTPAGRGVYVAGFTGSSDMNVTADALDPSYNGGINDVFLMIFDRQLSSLQYATYMGGSGEDACSGFACDSDGNPIISGMTASVDFPCSPTGYNTTYNGGDRDSFIARLRFKCCAGRVGDANGLGVYPDEITLGDIMLMVDVLFISNDCTRLACPDEADVNQSGGANPPQSACLDYVSLGDIMTLVDFLFITGPDVAVLPECL